MQWILQWGRVINKMLFALRDSVNEKAFLECVEGLEKTYEEKALFPTVYGLIG